MKKIRTPDGVVHNFPDDATDAEISAILNAGALGATPPPVGRPAQNLAQPQLDWVDRNIGQPLGIVSVDPATGRGVPAESPLRPVARPLAEGMTLGFLDEAEGLGEAVGGKMQGAPQTWEELYNRAVEASRDRSRAQREAHPVVNTVLNIVGGLAAGGPSGSAAKAPMTLKQAVGTGAKVGATYGGVAGVGSGEGGLAERAVSGAIGAGTGAALGAGIPLAVAGVGKAVQATKNALNLGNIDERAQNLILRALERDGMTPQQALARYQSWQSQGAKPEALMDLGGENLRRLARDVTSVPGKSADVANKFLDERQAAQGERIMGDFAKFMPDESFYGTIDDLAKTRAESASPIYQEAYRAAGEVWNPELARLASRPSMKAAWARAQKLAAEQDRTLPNVFKEGTTEGLENVPGKMPTLEAWDYMKQGLDDLLEGYRDKTTGKLVLDKLGRAIDATRRELISTLDAQVEKNVGAPVYAMARNQWAGPSQAMDAMKMGEGFLSKDAEITAKAIAGMSEAEKQFFRIGVTKAIKDTVEKVRDGNDVVKRVFGTPAMRAKIRAAFPDFDSFSQFETLIRREAAMFNNMVKARAGSRTAEVLAGQRELTAEPGFLTSLFMGDLGGAARQGMAHLARRGQGISQQVSDKLADLLFTPNMASIQATAGALARQRAALASRTSSRQGATGTAVRGLAAASGQGAGALTNYNRER